MNQTYTKYLCRRKLGPVHFTLVLYSNAWSLHVGWWRG
jgi:hypothetical protein